MPRLAVILAAIVTVTLIVGAQLLIKGRLNVHGVVPVEPASFARYIFGLMADWVAWLAVIMMIAAAIVWYTTLSRTSLSVAYPLIALSYPAIMIGSAVFLQETIGWNVIAANILIVGAMVLIGLAP